ncbi:hypothetical protein COSHB9_10610 [Companilactobacillus alimentarius]|uniref:hypothetical protein n=1 Tax=Companilactobacillus alimentarius TaxID=1602 RepID=UPI0028B8C539|nr:hypothetical protein [Companilactobacillus alimentarius]MDT6952641.1 hypothetical protein [Companilactobacillus alimentarius]
MNEKKVPKVVSVNLLPNFYLKVDYEDGSIRYAKGSMYYTETHLFEKSAVPYGGLLTLTPAWYWIGPEVKLRDNNSFVVNGKEYDGNKVFEDNVRHF